MEDVQNREQLNKEEQIEIDYTLVMNIRAWLSMTKGNICRPPVRLHF